MNQTELTLLEQMRITALEVEHRKALLGFSSADADVLLRFGAVVRGSIHAVVDALHDRQSQIDEFATVIGDADTLRGLHIAQRKYVLELFHGVYDIDYVQSRLRVGLALKRIGVDPKLYLAVISMLKDILFKLIDEGCLDVAARKKAQQALDKLIVFDVTLVFETYMRTMVTEIELGKDRVMRYARELEQRVAERTAALERLSRIDPLTGLFNRRVLAETLQREIRIAERTGKPLALIYIDVDRFKEINDRYGHQKGDEVLIAIGDSMRAVSREIDLCFRLGGDEFCVLLTHSTEDEARRVYCERLRRLLAERSQHLGGVSLSIGIAQTGPEAFDDADELVKRADKAMYDTRRSGKTGISTPDATSA